MSDTPTPGQDETFAAVARVLYGESTWSFDSNTNTGTSTFVSDLAAAGYRVVPVPDEDEVREVEQALDGVPILDLKYDGFSSVWSDPSGMAGDPIVFMAHIHSDDVAVRSAYGRLIELLPTLARFVLGRDAQ